MTVRKLLSNKKADVIAAPFALAAAAKCRARHEKRVPNARATIGVRMARPFDALGALNTAEAPK